MQEYPEELKLIPSHVIGLVNLPKYHDKLEGKLKASSLKNTKILKFKSIDDLYERKAKTKRGYTGYSAQGVLKRGWMRKHQNEVAAVLLVVVPLDLDKSLKEEESQILEFVEDVKKKVDGVTKPKLILLIISNDTIPVSHFFDEFLKNVKALGGFDNKTLYCCERHNIDSPLSMTKLDKVITDLSFNFYKETCQRVRRLKNEVKKETQPALYTRHRFKVGFYQEILGNPAKALKYYTQSYEAVRTVKAAQEGFKEKELHFVADFVNFKICYVKARDGKIVEAINQFLSHMSWLRRHCNKFEREHEYYKNMHKQYRMFSELLSLNKGQLNLRIMYQNPGFFYQLAATYGDHRKVSGLEYRKLYGETCKKVYSQPSKNFGSKKLSDETLVYEGYVGTDVYYLKDDEKRKIFAAKENFIRSFAEDVYFPHDEVVLQMLQKSYEWLKSAKYRGYRKRCLHVLSDIADRHYRLKNYRSAKDTMQKIRRFYFQQGWYELLTPIMKKLLHCSRVLKTPNEFVTNCLFLMSKLFPEDKEQKKTYEELLVKFFDNPRVVGGKHMVGTNAILDLANNKILIECRVNFESPFTVIHQDVNFCLRLFSKSVFPLSFDGLEIRFSEPKYDIKVPGPVSLLPGENLYEYSLKIEEKLDVEVVSISLLKKGNLPFKPEGESEEEEEDDEEEDSGEEDSEEEGETESETESDSEEEESEEEVDGEEVENKYESDDDFGAAKKKGKTGENEEIVLVSDDENEPEEEALEEEEPTAEQTSSEDEKEKGVPADDQKKKDDDDSSSSDEDEEKKKSPAVKRERRKLVFGRYNNPDAKSPSSPPKTKKKKRIIKIIRKRPKPKVEKVKKKKKIIVLGAAGESRKKRKKAPTPTKNELVLRWKYGGRVAKERIEKFFKEYDPRQIIGSKLSNFPFLRVKEPPSNLKMNFVSQKPLLIGEKFKVVLEMCSETEHILGGNIFVNSTQHRDIVVYDGSGERNQRILPLKEIKPGKTERIVIYISASTAEIKKLTFSSEYRTTLFPKMSSSSTFEVTSVYPVRVDFTVLGTRPSIDTDVRRITPSRSVSFSQIPTPAKKKLMLAAGESQNSSGLIMTPHRTSKKNSLFFTTETMVLATMIQCVTPFPLVVKEVKLLQNRQLKSLTPRDVTLKGNDPQLFSNAKKKKGLLEAQEEEKDQLLERDWIQKKWMNQGDVLTMNHLLVSEELLDSPSGSKKMGLGTILVKCERMKTEDENSKEENEEAKEEMQLVESDFTLNVDLPEIMMANCPIGVFFDHESEGILGCPVDCKVTVQNRSESLQEIQVTIRENDSFFISGIMEATFDIIPYGKRVLEYRFIPVSTGKLQLPKFIVASVTSSLVVTNKEMATIFVKQQNKSS